MAKMAIRKPAGQLAKAARTVAVIAAVAAAKRAVTLSAKKKATAKAAPARGRKHVYFFGGGKAEGGRTMRDALGGKGANLAEMTNAGLPVPAGFTISTDVCSIYYKGGGKIPASIESEIRKNIQRLEK